MGVWACGRVGVWACGRHETWWGEAPERLKRVRKGADFFLDATHLRCYARRAVPSVFQCGIALTGTPDKMYRNR